MQKYYKKLLIVFVVMTVLLSGVGAEPTDGDSVYMGSSRYEYQGGKWIPVSGPDAQGTGGNSGSDSSSDYDDSSAREAYAQAHSAAETELSIDASTNASVGAAVNSIDSVESTNTVIDDTVVQSCNNETQKTEDGLASIEKVTANNGSSAESAYSEINSAVTADPVRYATGEYIENDNDLTINWGITDFIISRNYGIQNGLTGTSGFGWENSFDQRLIIGINNDAWEAVNIQKSYVEYLETTRDTISKTITARYKVSSVQTAYAEIESRLNTCKTYQNRAKRALEEAENHQAYGSNFSDLRSKADTNYRNAQNNYSAITRKINEYTTVLSSLPEQVNYYNRILSDIEKENAELSLLTALAERCDAITTLNGKTRYPGTPTYYYEQGLGTVTTVDEDGNIHSFVIAEDRSEEYLPVSPAEHDYLKVYRSEDGTWTAVKKNGTEKLYREDGFLVRETDRYGNWIAFERSIDGRTTAVTTSNGGSYTVEYSETGYISNITNNRDTTENVCYSYTGKHLSSVTDADGDTTRFEYNADGILTSLLKPDGSSIRLTHCIREDGTYITTATTNEEEYTEFLEYDWNNNHTVYTDHDGNKAEYWFDGNYQTVHEIYPDGTIIYNKYDESRNLTEETVNGNITRYAYNAYGEKIRATYSDGSTEQWEYDSYGNVSLYKDRDNVVYEYVRDIHGNLSEYRIAGKTAALFEYDGTGKIVKKTIKSNNPVETTYIYDSYGNLAEEVTGGISTAYRYDTRNRITAAYLDGELQQTYTYTAKTTTVSFVNGLTTAYTWNARKDLVSISQIDTITGEERTVTYEYDRRHLPIGQYVNGELTARRRYTPEGNLEAELAYSSDKDILTTYLYNGELIENMAQFAISGVEFDFSNVNLESLKAVAVSAGEYADVNYRKVNGANNTSIVYITDQLNRTTSAGYDPWGNVVSVTDALGNASRRILTSGGRLLTEQSAHGGLYDYDYNPQGLLAKSGESGSGDYVTAEYYDDGSVKSITNRYGETTEYTYNERGLTASVRSEGRTVWYEYDSQNRVILELTGEENNMATAETYVTYSYSLDGRTITAISGNLYKTVYQLNAYGETVSVTDGLNNKRTYTYNKRGQLTAARDAYGYATKYEYTDLGQLSKITRPDGSFIRYEYNFLGNCILQSDAMGIIWHGTYDEAGRLTAEKGRPGLDREYEYDELDRITCVKTAGNVVERYSYTDRGRTVVFTDGAGNGYIYEKDAYGRTVSEENRIGGIQKYEYDEEGLLKSKVDFNGNVTSYERENGTTVTTTQYADGTSTRITYSMTGNIIKAENPESIMTYTYNKAGLLTGQKDELTGEITEYVYDAAGHRVQMKVSYGRQISTNVLYKYGKNGELLSENDSIARTTVTFKYDRDGREITRTYGNGVSMVTSYDEAGRICAVNELNSHAKLLWGEAYVYDSDTGLRTATVNNNAEVTLYEYDTQSRISTVWYPSSAELLTTMKEDARENGLTVFDYMKATENRRLNNRELVMIKAALGKVSPAAVFMLLSSQDFTKETFTYDANGNRITRTLPYGTIMYMYDAENRLLSSGCNAKPNAVVYSYDNNGNMLSRKSSYGLQEYTYNAIDRMSQSSLTSYVTGHTTSTLYGYDSFGRRTTEQLTGNDWQLRTSYDGFTLNAVKEQVIYRNSHTYDAMGPARTTLYAGNTPVAEKRGLTTSYFGTDLSGSVRSVTGLLGTQTDMKNYDVFGTPLSVTNGVNAWYEKTVSTSYGYLGKPYDATTKLYNYGYRDYSSRIGRFTSVDPIRDGNNWYTYVQNDPVNFRDLFGLSAGDIAAGEEVLQKAATRTDKLKDLVNTNNLAQIMSTNIDSFDPATRAYYQGMPESVRTSAIKEQLNKTTVYSGINPAVEQAVFDNFGAQTTVKDGLTIGNSIYVLDEISSMDKDTADFLAHEAVHVISSSVVGKVEFTVYNASAPYDNEYERAAYAFGGWADSEVFVTPPIVNNKQILDYQSDWWK